MLKKRLHEGMKGEIEKGNLLPSFFQKIEIAPIKFIYHV